MFRVVEVLHTDGDAYVREAATIGLLESIQNVAGNIGVDPECFVPHLEPETSKWWAKLNAFWNGDASGPPDPTPKTSLPYRGPGMHRRQNSCWIQSRRDRTHGEIAPAFDSR